MTISTVSPLAATEANERKPATAPAGVIGPVPVLAVVSRTLSATIWGIS
jgi:hypothetical protein